MCSTLIEASVDAVGACHWVSFDEDIGKVGDLPNAGLSQQTRR